jgi:hypothetical protein
MRYHGRPILLRMASLWMTGDSLPMLTETGRDEHLLDTLISCGIRPRGGEDTFAVPALEICRQWAGSSSHWRVLSGTLYAVKLSWG